jgi:MFS transporter, DHA1 family, staphyloferrin A biosynthesis exporter
LCQTCLTTLPLTDDPLFRKEDKTLFASLKVPDYVHLWIGMLTSAFAMNMQLVAQGWLVYEMSSSALDLTFVTLAFMLPQVIFSLPGGVIADRFPKKIVIGYAPVLNAAATLVMALVVMFGNVTFWDFIWVGFLNGMVMALSIPARTAFIPEIVGEKLMFNAMAFNTASWNLSRILGPALAGFMIAIFAQGDTSSSFGVGLVYFVLSSLYLVSAVTVLFIKHDGHPTPGEKKSATADIVEGLTYVFRSPIVGGLILLSIMPFLFGLSINTLLPAFNTDVLDGGPEDLGLLMTGMGVGAILGSLTLAKLGNVRHKGYWVLSTEALWGLALAAFALATTFDLAVIAISVIGFVSAVNMSMNRSLVQLQVEQHMRGRIMSIDLMSHGLMPLGILPIGYLSEVVSVEAGLATSGLILCLSTILLGYLMPAIRAIDTGYKFEA